MQVVRLDDISGRLRSSVVTVGNFDGVHRGHQALIREMVRRAQQRGAASLVVTFDPHTRSVLAPQTPGPLLTTLEEKALIIQRLGVDVLVWIRFDTAMSHMPPQRFVDEVLIDQLGAVEWVMGDGHAFGYGRTGDQEVLRNLVGGKHFSVSVLKLVTEQGAVVSSTEIRAEIMNGAVRSAADSLGHPYAIVAERVRGVGTAGMLGFPTFNFGKPPAPKVLPPPGVYAGKLQFGETEIAGAMYFGDCPTFEHRDLHFEFHALEVPDLEPKVGEDACLWVYDRLRPDREFGTAEELSEQIAKDVRSIRQFFSRE